MTTITTSTMTVTEAKDHATMLALERGYSHPQIYYGVLVVKCGTTKVDYVNEILAPRGLVPCHHFCLDWFEACRLLSMLPPARGGLCRQNL